MYKTLTYHIGDDDRAVEMSRADDNVHITVFNGDEALEVFIDPVHFAALRKAIGDAEGHAAGRGFLTEVSEGLGGGAG